MIIRPATIHDAAAIRDIYNYYVLNTTISFEENLVGIEEMQNRIAQHKPELPWLVCVDEEQVLAYAYATPWRVRSAYRFSVETTVYVAREQIGKGLGTQLYRTLIDQLRSLQLHSAIAGIALPNQGSVALHESIGFKKVAEFEEVGMKFDEWVNVGYWQLLL